MLYYAAPMEGLTDRVWRQAHQRWFGGADRYYAPFLSPPENRVPVQKKMADLARAANPGAPLIPQLLGRDGDTAAWMVGLLREMGYDEVNLNFGCPAGTVTAKGKGAGMLRDPDALDRFLDAVFRSAGGPISVKTRLGVADAAEFDAILAVYNRYPLAELIIHPRVMRQLYRGRADRAAFAAALPAAAAPVCYNGDIATPADIDALRRAFPSLPAVMVGRGLIADPALLRSARGGPPLAAHELQGYMAELYAGYTAAFGSPQAAVSRMKAFWHYNIGLFDGAEGLWRRLKKVREGWEYEVVAAQIFTLPLRGAGTQKPAAF